MTSSGVLVLHTFFPFGYIFCFFCFRSVLLVSLIRDLKFGPGLLLCGCFFVFFCVCFVVVLFLLLCGGFVFFLVFFCGVCFCVGFLCVVLFRCAVFVFSPDGLLFFLCWLVGCVLSAGCVVYSLGGFLLGFFGWFAFVGVMIVYLFSAVALAVVCGGGVWLVCCSVCHFFV